MVPYTCPTISGGQQEEGPGVVHHVHLLEQPSTVPCSQSIYVYGELKPYFGLELIDHQSSLTLLRNLSDSE